jgi:hypothetical protein
LVVGAFVDSEATPEALVVAAFVAPLNVNETCWEAMADPLDVLRVAVSVSERRPSPSSVRCRRGPS